MKILSLHLRNIRSYVNETITFPEGRVLLSGDIGSGKTTILLAIEFALFGLLRGKTRGNTLLRYGTDKAEVSLTLHIDNKEITIHRSLKRSKRSIRQDKTWLKIDGEKTECTATELKANVIDLLGYPQSMVSGSKNMVYRYSVYTPQEKMKQILSASKENRLKKIRKIFRIDKYQRLTDNADTYRKELRSRIRSLDGVEKKIQTLKKDIEDIQEKIKNTSKKIKQKKSQQKKVKENVQKIKQKLEETKKIKETYQDLQRKKSTLQETVKNKKETLKTLEKKRKRKQAKLKKDLEKPKEPQRTEEEIQKTQEKLENISTKNTEKISTKKAKITQLQQKKKKVQRKKQRIGSLETCPKCKQKVDEQHKQKLEDEYSNQIQEAKQEIKSLEKELSKHQTKKKKIESRKKKIKTLLTKTRRYQKNLASYKQQKKQRQDLKEDLEEITKERQKTKENIENAEEKLKEIKEKLKDIAPNIEAQKDIEQKKEQEQSQLKSIEVSLAKYKQQQTHNQEEKERLQEEKKKRDVEKKKKETYAVRENWLKEQFQNLTSLIEKHVFLTLHRSFNETFQSFFKDLIEADSIEARIDSEFSPIITQNGYDSTIDNLSGGEKTSVALAYRLGLNHTINEKMQDVKTKSILILDEPTDGFSSDQLDRFRDILDSLHTTQTIIVSHEPKMESVTEKILRVQKNNESSHVTTTQEVL